MKTRIYYLPLMVAAFSVYSCSEDAVYEPQYTVTRSSENQSFGEEPRSLEEALDFADQFFSQFEGIPQTRSSRAIESVEYITTGERTRAGGMEMDTLFYLVNYASEQGFALLGRPSQSYDIYAISTEGRLRMSDTIKNKGLAEFFDLATMHAKAANRIALPTDSVKIDVKWYYNITRQVSPLLHANISVWNQEAPFNKYCPMVNDNRGVTGCGPVAVATLMAHYKWPNNMNGKYINWNAIVEGNDYDKIARLIEDLAAPEYLNAQYNKDKNGNLIYYSRGIYPSSVNPTMNKWRYDITNAFNWVSFKSARADAFDFMKNGYQFAPPSPILMCGYGTNGEGGHIWVVDGFIEREKISSLMLHNPFAKPIEVDPLLHMVWGWGGYGNGYYAYLRDSNLLEKDPQTGPIMNTQFGALSIFGRYVKRYTDQ